MTKKVNEIYNKYKSHFPNSFFHNLLWQLLVNKSRKLTDAAFVPVIKTGYTELGIADKGEKGFQPTGVIFATHNHDEAQMICHGLNLDLFGLKEEEAEDIVFSSF